MEQTSKDSRTTRAVLYWALAAACAVLSVVFFNQHFKAAAACGIACVLGAVLLVCLYFVLKDFNFNVTGKAKTYNLAFTGMMAALVLVGYFLTVRLPIGEKAQIGFGNVFCIFSGLLLGPIFGGLAAGLGSFLFDIISGWGDTCLLTFVTKFIMAFVCGALAWGVRGQQLSRSADQGQILRTALAAVAGSVAYSILYLADGYVQGALLGNAAKALDTLLHIKLAVTVVNGVIADVVAVPLFYALRQALKRNHLAFNA